MKKNSFFSLRFPVFCFWLILATFVLSGCSLKLAEKQVGDQGQPSPMPTKPLEETIFDRPFVSLEPTTDGHWVNLQVNNIKEGTKSIDYELIYFAGDIGNQVERGVAGSIELKGEKSFARKILFGSESCTVKCKYKFDENISEGVLTLKLRNETGTEKFESAFRLQKGSEAAEGLSTGDGNFKFVAKNLAKNSYFLTISTIGVPKEFEGKIGAVPYGIFPSSSAKGEVFFKANEEAAILVWDGTKWLETESSLVDGWLRTSVQKTGIFVLVKQ